MSPSYKQAMSPGKSSHTSNPGRKTCKNSIATLTLKKIMSTILTLLGVELCIHVHLLLFFLFLGYVIYPPSQPPNQGRNLEMTIKLQKMNEEFAALFYLTRKALEELHLPNIIEYIEAHVVSLLSPNDQTPAKKELVRKEFHQSEDARQLFYVLEKHVSWFNYSFIFKIVKVFLQKNKSLKESWSSYDNAIKEYFMTGEGQAIQCVDAVAFGLSDIPGTKAMIFKVERDDYTLNDLAIIYHQIPSALKVPNARFYFSSVTMGCLELNYLIPNYLYLILFPFNEEQLQNLASIDGVSKLKCGKHTYNINEVCN